MRVRPLTILLIALVAGALAWLALNRGGSTPARPVGMTETPCTAGGVPVTQVAGHDWPGLCYYRAQNAELRKSGQRPRVVLIGDSITQAWPNLDQPAGSFVGRGIPGQTSGQVLLRFRQDAADLRPQVIHLLVGINDVSGVTGPNAPDMYQANILAMLDMAQVAGIPVVIGTIPPAKDFYWQPDLKPGPWVPLLNDWIRRTAAERGLVVADYYAVLANSDGSIRAPLYKDGAHPGAAGYAAMQPVLDAALARALDGALDGALSRPVGAAAPAGDGS